MDYRPKKGLDIWLNDKGYYRKHVALDETCFFRSVSDQVYNTQIYHEDIRKQCVEFALENHNLFKDIDLGDSEWSERMDKLKKHFVECGYIEMQIISKMLKYDFIIVDANTFTSSNVTRNGYKKFIHLCKMKDNHYDSICSKKQIEDSGFVQSIVYKLLYENVFGFDNIDNVVQSMLYADEEETERDLNLFDSIFPVEDVSKTPPFPYKVAKALDPYQYRNIEFDAWNQTRKELRLKDWYFGGEDFKVGTKCLLILDNNILECYIQELTYQNRNDTCLVYVVEWATKKVVKRKALMPIPDAKPWPLPYAIARNVKNEDPTTVPIVEDSKLVPKRRKNKRRPAYKDNKPVPQNDNNNNNNVNCYEGCPLVASPNEQYFNEELNACAVYNPEIVDGNYNYSLPFEPAMNMPYDPNYSGPYQDYINSSVDEQSFSDEWPNNSTWLPPEGAPLQCCGSVVYCAHPYCVPVPYETPYVLPSPFIVNMNSPMLVATHESNTVIQDGDTKVTHISSKYVETTYVNNNSPVPNLNYPAPVPSPVMLEPNYPEYQPQMMPSPNYFNYENQIMPGPIYPAPNYPQMVVGPLMPMPPPSPDTFGPPVPPFGVFPQPVICPCYLAINPVIVPVPNIPVPQPNVPMLPPVPDDLASKFNGPNVGLQHNSVANQCPILPPGYFTGCNNNNC